MLTQIKMFREEPFFFSKKEKLREEPFKKVLHPKRTDVF